MTVEELEGKLTSIYHEFAETISENETDESIYFDSDEEMEGWLESFRQEFGKPFIYIE